MTPAKSSLVRMVVDPHDHKPRPFCASIGTLVKIAFQQNRLLSPTPEEDALWRRDGQAAIDRRQGRAVSSGAAPAVK